MNKSYISLGEFNLDDLYSTLRDLELRRITATDFRNEFASYLKLIRSQKFLLVVNHQKLIATAIYSLIVTPSDSIPRVNATEVRNHMAHYLSRAEDLDPLDPNAYTCVIKHNKERCIITPLSAGLEIIILSTIREREIPLILNEKI